MNPFIHHPQLYYYLGFQNTPRGNIKILDYGCGSGVFANSILKKTKNVYACDVNRIVINKAKKRYPKVKFKSIKIGSKLPYKDNFFDVVYIFHTLEHVDSEEKTLKDIGRVLKRGGTLLLASPYKGIFSWADLANLRYNFPQIHQYLYKKIYGNEIYVNKFVKAELFGDCSPERNRHKHYDKNEINILLRRKYRILLFEKYSLFFPLLLIPYNLYLITCHKESKFINKLLRIDSSLKAGNFSYNFFCIAIKE